MRERSSARILDELYTHVVSPAFTYHNNTPHVPQGASPIGIENSTEITALHTEFYLLFSVEQSLVQILKFIPTSELPITKGLVICTKSC